MCSSQFGKIQFQSSFLNTDVVWSNSRMIDLTVMKVSIRACSIISVHCEGRMCPDYSSYIFLTQSQDRPCELQPSPLNTDPAIIKHMTSTTSAVLSCCEVMRLRHTTYYIMDEWTTTTWAEFLTVFILTSNLEPSKLHLFWVSLKYLTI